MKNKAWVVDVVLAGILVFLAVFSFREGGSAAAFAEKNKPVYQVQTEEKCVALMFNVYGGEAYLAPLSKILSGHRATFFIGGCWAKDHREYVEQLSKQGFELGNHGYNHKLHTSLSDEDGKNEIRRTNALIEEITGQRPVLFAPPAGDVNEAVVRQARACGCTTVMWTADTIDWRDRDAQKITARVKRKLQPGALILMHPTAATAEALPGILAYLEEQGYQTCTVSALLQK